MISPTNWVVMAITKVILNHGHGHMVLYTCLALGKLPDTQYPNPNYSNLYLNYRAQSIPNYNFG